MKKGEIDKLLEYCQLRFQTGKTRVVEDKDSWDTFLEIGWSKGLSHSAKISIRINEASTLQEIVCKLEETVREAFK
jgi:hypothetical protein